ncbi:MAG: leucine-rich repeat domain-containing protein [Muribaculaceae bacterium]|nr:leucine-rich repeat domain-containing protein [Muribaculaceae bacterium]
MNLSSRIIVFLSVVIAFLFPSPMEGKKRNDRDIKHFKLSENRDTLLKYTGSKAIIDLTAYPQLNELKVIGRSAFESNQKIKEIILPPQLKEIGKSAFSYCSIPTAIEYNGPSV